MQWSSDSLLVSGVKREGLHVSLFREASIRYKDKQKKEVFLFVPEAGTTLLG
jgi:hypothetical protein